MLTSSRFPRWSFWPRFAPLILTAGLFLARPVTAATSLTWTQCIERISRANPDLRVARENLKAAEYQMRGTFSGFFPQVSSSVSYNHTGGTSSTPSTGVVASAGGGISTAATSGYTASLSGALNLFNGFQDTFKVQQAEANRKAAEYAYEVARAQVSYNLKSTFANLLFAQNSLQLADDIIGRREDNLRLVELRFESGRENRGSHLLSKAYLAQARLDRLTASNNIIVGQKQFIQVLGDENLEDVVLVGSVPEHDPGETPDLQKLALENPSRLQLKAQEDAAAAAVRLALGNFSPTLGVSGSLSRQGSEWFPQTERWTVGVSVAIPLFNGGRDYYATQTAAANRESASASVRTTALKLLGGLANSFTNFVQTIEKLKVDRQFLEAVSVRAEIARGKYNNGLLTFEDWDIIESDLITRQKNVLQSQQSRTVAEANWENTQGKGSIQ